MLCVVLLAGWIALQGAGPSEPDTDPVSDIVRDLPADVDVTAGMATPSDFDVFSWESFLALNAPADETALSDAPDHEPVWATWMEDFQILVGDGQVPPPWGAPRSIPAACRALATDTQITRVLTHTAKTAGVVNLFEQAQAGPLIDQNGAYVRYEILVNAPMYDYIVDNRLYNLTGLNGFGRIEFPSGNLRTGDIGAIMIKAAWKVMGAGDDPTRFHVTQAYVVDPKAQSCATERLGLVGLHISTKTLSAPQWIWSTFEHVDNVPDRGTITPRAHYNFFDPDCDLKRPGHCVENAMPALPWSPDRPGQMPAQITRVTPIGVVTATLNAKYQALLRDANPLSVWANYMLVGTQFPQLPGDRTDPTGRAFPQSLSNTTLETFLQGDTPPVSSSCVGCHNRATTTASAKPSDFTYILSRVTAKY
ncbi:MAG: hypothetical protein AAGL96_04260 [Pseudomonadota bacterium]